MYGTTPRTTHSCHLLCSHDMSSSARRDKPKDAAAAPLDLLDEYWFFNNTLNGRSGKSKRPPLLPKPPSPSSKCSEQTRRDGGRRLLRTPSLPPLPPLPPPRVGMELKEEEAEEGEGGVDQQEEDVNWSSIYEGVLRTRIAEGGGGSRRTALHRAPSMPVPSSETEGDGRDEETAVTKSTPSLSRLTYSYSSLERHCHSHSLMKDKTPRTSAERNPQRSGGVRSFSATHQTVAAGTGSRCKSALQEKKWKSSSDLESIEVQGFRDLGFVFDKEELKASMAGVLPGLRDKKTCASATATASDAEGDGHGNDVVRRPYLSEAWHMQRSAPPAIRLQADGRSATEMKDQIRLWAQAVACNVRQEC